MSRRFRSRMTALGLCGLVLGAPLTVAGAALAEESGRQVSFGGAGVLGLSCGSQPSVEAMTVPAGSVVRVVNRTGHDARLELAGETRGTIPADGMAEVVFRRGATPVLLTPECAFGAEAGAPVLVTAAPSPSAEEPDPEPGRSRDDAATVLSKPSGKGAPARSSTRAQRAEPRVTEPRPTRTGKKEPRRGTRSPAASPAMTTASPAATTAQPQSDVPARLKTRHRARPFAGTGDEAHVPGMPPGGRAVEVVPPLSDADYVAALGLEPGPDGLPPLSEAPSVVATGRIPDDRPMGLLAMTAVVCLLGVVTAAIRAIVSQRASRANVT